MNPIRHTLRMILGVGLVVIGVIGLILPVMPGWIFLIPGLLILGDYFPPVKRLVDWAKQRFAEAEDQYRKHRGTDANAPEEPDAPDNGLTKEDSPEDSDRLATKARHSQQ